MKVNRLLPLLIVPVMLASCKNTQDSGYEDPYVSNFGSDGTYNPYPSGGGYDAPSYETPPVDDYAFHAPSSPPPSRPSTTASKPSTTSSSRAASSTRSTTTRSSSSAARTTASSSRTHTVVKGETLYGLSRKYGTTVAKIKSANGLSSDLIRIGQKLKIP